jgi:colanic acid biosynthesis glycosyl transferase WcaI
MNILYVAQYYPPECCAPAARVDEFTREWARQGHRVTVLTGFPNHPEGIVHAAYREPWRKGFSREERKGVNVCRTWLYPAPNRGLWGRAANYSSFALSAALSGTWVGSGQSVVIATSPQILVGAAGRVVARLRRLPFVFEVRDLWPQSLEAVGQASAGSLLYRAVGRLAEFLYRHADRIVVDGEWKRRALVAAGVPWEKIALIRNGVTDDFCLDPTSSAAGEARERVRSDLGLRGRFVVLYAGTLGMAHRLETVLEAAFQLRERRELVFLMVGEGADREKLTEQSGRMGLTNVVYLGKQPREAIPGYLAAADVCLVPLRRSEVFKTAIPCKMFEAMAAAKPVVLGVEGEAKEILTAARAGIVVPPEDPRALSTAILRLWSHPRLCCELGENGRDAVLRKHSRASQARAYLELLAELSPNLASSRVSERTPSPQFTPNVGVRLIHQGTEEGRAGTAALHGVGVPPLG